VFTALTAVARKATSGDSHQPCLFERYRRGEQAEEKVDE
jgi:hypothetical protein